MNIEQTWRNGYTGKDIVVAIVDDGVWYNNSDLLPNYVSQFNLTTQGGYCHVANASLRRTPPN